MKDATFRIHGRLGSDVEFRTGQNQKQHAIISVATEERYMKDNEEVRKTHWHRLVCFKPNLMNYLAHFKKGMLADFEGVIKQSERTDTNGEKQYGTNLEVDDARLIGFLEKRNNQNQAPQQQNQAPQQNQNQTPPQQAAQGGYANNQQQAAPQNAYNNAGNGYGGHRG